MSLASDITADILASLQHAGQSATLRKVNEGTYDPTSGSVSGDDVDDYDITALMHGYRNSDIDGERILMQDRRCIISASGLAVAPETGDKIVYSSVIYSVISVKTYEVNGTVTAYSAQCRA